MHSIFLVIKCVCSAYWPIHSLGIKWYSIFRCRVNASVLYIMQIKPYGNKQPWNTRSTQRAHNTNIPITAMDLEICGDVKEMWIFSSWTNQIQKNLNCWLPYHRIYTPNSRCLKLLWNLWQPLTLKNIHPLITRLNSYPLWHYRCCFYQFSLFRRDLSAKPLVCEWFL